MCRYFDSSLNVTEELLTHIKYAKTSYQYEAIVDHRYNKDSRDYEFRVKWLGFSKKENTWEPLTNAFEDHPEQVEKYVKSLPSATQADIYRSINSKSTILIRPHTTTSTNTSTNNIATDDTDATHHFTPPVDQVVTLAENGCTMALMGCQQQHITFQR